MMNHTAARETAAKTEAVIAAILTTSHTHRIAPSLFSHCFGRAATSAAFRLAKARGLIELAYVSVVGTPVYRLTDRSKVLVSAEGTVQ